MRLTFRQATADRGLLSPKAEAPLASGEPPKASVPPTPPSTFTQPYLTQEARRLDSEPGYFDILWKVPVFARDPAGWRDAFRQVAVGKPPFGEWDAPYLLEALSVLDASQRQALAAALAGRKRASGAAPEPETLVARLVDEKYTHSSWTWEQQPVYLGSWDQATGARFVDLVAAGQAPFSDRQRAGVRRLLEASTPRKLNALAAKLEGRFWYGSEPGELARPVQYLLDLLCKPGGGGMPEGALGLARTEEPESIYTRRHKERQNVELAGEGSSTVEASFPHGGKTTLTVKDGKLTVRSENPGLGFRPATLFVGDQRVPLLPLESWDLFARALDYDSTFPSAATISVKPTDVVRVLSDGDLLELTGDLKRYQPPALTDAARVAVRDEAKRIIDADPRLRSRQVTFAELEASLERDPREVLTLSGYFASGYGTPEELIAAGRAFLSKLDPKKVILHSGGGEGGIGDLVRLAKEDFGFDTITTRSCLAPGEISPYVDRFALAGDDWTEAPAHFGKVAARGHLLLFGGNFFSVEEAKACLRMGGKVTVIRELSDGHGNLSPADELAKLRPRPANLSVITLDKLEKLDPFPKKKRQPAPKIGRSSL